MTNTLSNAVTPEVNLRKLLAGAQLPALPASAVRLLELSQQPGRGTAEFAPPIEADPGLTGQVLRFVNSSYFGFAREISSIPLAITLVGIRTITNFALWSAVFSLLPNPRCGPFDLKSLWQDALRRALFARATARLLGQQEADEPFAAALLQDMAVPLLAKHAPLEYVQLLKDRGEGRIRLSLLEERLFGWTHAEAAGVMARQWNLPDEFALLVEHHQEIERWAGQPAANPGRLAVALSALLPTIADPVWHECRLFERYYAQIVPTGSPDVVEILGTIDQEFAAFAPLLKVAMPAKSLVDGFHEVAARTAS